jgi:hypothetical protein
VSVNVAVTDCAALTVTVHVPVPEHPEPFHPEKADPVPAVAVSVTEVPESNVADVDGHVVPHAMPAGLLVTVPDPLPDLFTVSWFWFWTNVAVRVWAEVIVTVHAAVPPQPSLHPLKLYPGQTVTFIVTMVPRGYVHVQGNGALSQPEPAPNGLTVTYPPGRTVGELILTVSK